MHFLFNYTCKTLSWGIKQNLANVKTMKSLKVCSIFSDHKGIEIEKTTEISSHLEFKQHTTKYSMSQKGSFKRS
jgi:hypothetical protein